MADIKSPRKESSKKAGDAVTDDDWKKIKHSDSQAGLEKGKGHYPVNEVDLTSVLPIPMHYVYTDDQKKMFGEFRKASKKCTEQHSDYLVGRFLVARKFKIKDSVELFDNAMTWREQQGVDDVLQTFPDNYWYKAILNYWPTSIHPEKQHLTKDGCPIVYERIGQVTPKMSDLIPRETLFLHHLYNVELMENTNAKIAEKLGFAPGTILIEDLGELTSSHLYNKITALITDISGSDEQHYPESIRKIYIVNPPAIFGIVWAIMKPFIEERTLQKFSFGVPKEFAAEWDAIIGKDNLPKYLGGNLDWAPPAGGDVAHLIPSDLVKKEIARKDELFIEISAKAGQIIHWQVMCKKDIGVGLHLKTGSGAKDRKAVAEWPVKKYEGDLSPHHGWYTSPEDATYLLHLDNTDSYFMSRKVKYFTYVKDPLKLQKKKADSAKSEKEETSGKAASRSKSKK